MMLPAYGDKQGWQAISKLLTILTRLIHRHNYKVYIIGCDLSMPSRLVFNVPVDGPKIITAIRDVDAQDSKVLSISLAVKLIFNRWLGCFKYPGSILKQQWPDDKNTAAYLSLLEIYNEHPILLLVQNGVFCSRIQFKDIESFRQTIQENSYSFQLRTSTSF